MKLPLKYQSFQFLLRPYTWFFFILINLAKILSISCIFSKNLLLVLFIFSIVVVFFIHVFLLWFSLFTSFSLEALLFSLSSVGTRLDCLVLVSWDRPASLWISLLALLFCPHYFGVRSWGLSRPAVLSDITDETDRALWERGWWVWRQNELIMEAALTGPDAENTC